MHPKLLAFGIFKFNKKCTRCTTHSRHSANLLNFYVPFSLCCFRLPMYMPCNMHMRMDNFTSGRDYAAKCCGFLIKQIFH